MRKLNQTSKEKIIVYTSQYIAPSEVWIGRQVEGHVRYEPIVCCIKKANVELYHGEKVVELRTQSYIKRRLDQLLYFVSLRGWPRSVYISAWKLAQQVCHYEAKLIHVHFLWNSLIPLTVKKTINIPVIFTAHGTDVNSARVDADYKDLLQKTVFQQAMRILTDSKFLKNKLLKFGCPHDKVYSHYQGAPIPEQYQRKFNTHKNIRIACVASFRPVKGHTYLINAFHRAFQQNPRLHLTLVGDGPERTTLEQQIIRLELEKQVKLTGWLPPQNVQADCDRLYFMNKGKIEDFGTFYELIQSSVTFRQMTKGLPATVNS